MKLIAVQGLTLSPQGIVVAGTGILVITSTPSTKFKIQTKGVYTVNLQFTLAGANATGYDTGTVVTVGTGTITATATKIKDSSGFAMRIDDQNLTVSMTGTIGGTPTPFLEPWKITNAGQIKMSGN